jgi:DNA-binding MarR family transcriptional regulator
MNIEQAIQQKKFANPHEKAIVNLFYTYSWLSSRHSQVFKKYGITLQQFNILRILRGQFPKPASVKLLTERMLDKSSNASRLVDKLLEKQLVSRSISPDDRRQVDVIITQEGLDLLDKAGNCLRESLISLKITPEEALLLSDLLDRLREENTTSL